MIHIETEIPRKEDFARDFFFFSIGYAGETESLLPSAPAALKT